MEKNIIIFITGTLLSVIGFLMVASLRQLMVRLKSIEDYMKDHDKRFDEHEKRFLEQDNKHYQTREKIHDIVNSEIVPLKLKLAEIERCHNND